MFKDEEGVEIRVNNYYNITTYWKDGVMIGKQCSKCGVVKSVSEFGFANKKKGKIRSKCKECEKEYCKENREKILERRRNYKEKTKEQRRKYYIEHKEYYKEKRKQYKEEHEEHLKEVKKRWLQSNKEKANNSSKKWREKVKKENIQNITNMLHQLNPILKVLNIKAHGYIYKITNIKTNRVYIGQTVRPINIRYEGEVVKSWIKERRRKLKQKFKEELVNKEDFTIEIIDIGICQYHLNVLEAMYIDNYNSFLNGYNNCNGHYKSDDGLEEFQHILSTHNLEYKDGKIIKSTSTDEID